MTTQGPGSGPSPLRLGGLALIGVAVIAALIGLSSMATGTDPGPTATPSPAMAPPGEPLPPGDGSMPAPSFGEPAPADTPPGAVPPGEPAPAPDAPQAAPQPEPAPGVAPEAPEAPAPGDGGKPMAAPPPPASSGSDARGEGDTSAVRAPLRVYNNSTISGLAARAAEDFRRAGWSIDEVGNYPHGIIPTTTVYFRPGAGEEEPARVLGEQFGMRVNPRFEGLQNATPGIIVIVTNDYGR